MYLWHRRAAPAWLSAHAPELEERCAGRMALVTLPGRARAIVEIVCDSRVQAAGLTKRFGGSAKPLPRNWRTKYEQKRAPLRIGRRLTILTEPDPLTGPQLIIPAAGAFGTGEHATTAMSLRLLEETTRKFSLGWRLFDAGAGTGILALAGRRFGASEVLGLDSDAAAVAHARENARRNKIDRAEFVRQDILTWKPAQRFEIITANLYSELLMAAVPTFRRALLPRGYLIVSGILRDQADDVAGALRDARFQIEQQRRRGKWLALLATRKT